MIAATVIDWGALGKVILYSVIAGVGVPTIYSLAVVGATRSTEAGRERRAGAAAVYAVLAALGGLACLAAMAYGVYLLTQKS